jgi:hypothetical protein
VSRRHFASSTLLALTLQAPAAITPALAQAPAGEAEVKAAFVYNFLKFVEWPPTSFRSPEEPLVVALVGDSATADATKRFLASKQIAGRRLVVRHLAWDDSLAGVHAVLVADADEARWRRIFAAASEAGVLSIGEGEAFAATGGVIALVIEERKVRFDIDMEVVRSSRLKISSKLLALTRVVRNDRDRNGGRR